MKSLEFVQMESTQGGDWISNLHGLSCGLALAWPIGTAIFGPTCVGLAFA
jgi:hypothetical protein